MEDPEDDDDYNPLSKEDRRILAEVLCADSKPENWDDVAFPTMLTAAAFVSHGLADCNNTAGPSLRRMADALVRVLWEWPQLSEGELNDQMAALALFHLGAVASDIGEVETLSKEIIARARAMTFIGVWDRMEFKVEWREGQEPNSKLH